MHSQLKREFANVKAWTTTVVWWVNEFSCLRIRNDPSPDVVWPKALKYNV